MVLLGVDPGLAATGWGVVLADGGRYRSSAWGCLRTTAQTELGARLNAIFETIAGLIREHRPQVLVMEHLYQLRDGSTGLAVGQAVGVVRLAAAQAGLEVAEYAPTHLKMTLVGYGGAEKHQVQYMVQRLLGLSAPPTPDHAADALALCICHLHSGLSRAGSKAAPSSPGVAESRIAESRIAAALAADERRRTAHARPS